MTTVKGPQESFLTYLKEFYEEWMDEELRQRAKKYEKEVGGINAYRAELDRRTSCRREL